MNIKLNLLQYRDLTIDVHTFSLGLYFAVGTQTAEYSTRAVRLCVILSVFMAAVYLQNRPTDVTEINTFILVLHKCPVNLLY